MRKKDAERVPIRMVAPRDFSVSVARNLLAFIATDGSADHRLGKVLSRQLLSAVTARFGVASVAEDVSGLMPEDVREIQQQIRSAIQAIRRGETFTFVLADLRPTEIEVGISRDFESHELHAGWLLPDRRVAFWMGVAAALEQAGDLIQECQRQECHNLYVRLRGQKYCSTPCSQRDRSAKYYDEHRDQVLERRHEAYVRAKRQHQKRARVPRRRRTR